MGSNSFIIDGFEFRATSKKRYEVYVCRPMLGSNVYNRLEGTHYITNREKQFVISGTVGETWVIDVNRLMRTYEFISGTQITIEALKQRVRYCGIIDWMHLRTRQAGLELNFAAHLPIYSIRNFPVQTPWGDILYANRDGVAHGSGDFLLCTSIDGFPDTSDMRVINGEVFPVTYNIRNFTDIVSEVQRVITPRPRSIFS